ncbi:MAG TPA: glycosyltransferase family 4 protein [Myxococcota bacterium]|nr:glycosyltransferase family 4 protein [Myxococcota bacterium]HQK49893.1 glycosyltransferase family 4 protein [Myxococcota bacterium]
MIARSRDCRLPTVMFVDSIDDPNLLEAGSRTVLRDLIGGLVPRGFRCLAVVRGEGRFPSTLRSLGAEVIPLRAPRGLPLYRRIGDSAVPSPEGFLSQAFLAPRAVSYWQDLFQDVRPDVVYIAHPLAHVLAGLGAWRASVPAVLHLQGIPQSSHRLKLMLPLYRGLCDLSGATIVAISRAVADAYGGPPGRRPRVIPNGVDTNRFHPNPPIPGRIPFPEGTPVVGWVGSLDVLKGVQHLPALVREVRQRVPAARFLVLGAEPHEDRGLAPTHSEAHPSPLLRSVLGALDEAGDLPAVAFLGRRPDVPELLRGMSVLVHLCQQEGFGLAVAEAGATGIPAVAYATGGPAEVIDPGATGLLIPPQAGIQGMADGVVGLLEDPDRRRRMGDAAVVHVRRHYSREAFLQAFADLFLEMVGPDRQRAKEA